MSENQEGEPEAKSDKAPEVQATTTVPPKRGRGRPRKDPNAVGKSSRDQWGGGREERTAPRRTTRSLTGSLKKPERPIYDEPDSDEDEEEEEVRPKRTRPQRAKRLPSLHSDSE